MKYVVLSLSTESILQYCVNVEIRIGSLSISYFFVIGHSLVVRFILALQDIDKLLDPKEFGWRFIGCDIKMPNGQLVECYVVFSAMELAKKRSNHNIFERWRWRQMVGG